MTRNECARWLLERDNFLILTHTRPDGDTIGSASTLCLGLRQLGKTAYLLENKEVSPYLESCVLGLTKSAPEDGDTILSVDVASPGMLQKEAVDLLDRIELRIDHHGSATSYTDEELVDPMAAACGEIVYDVLMEMGAELTKEMAWRLYIAVSTDTGCFRFANTTSHTFVTAAACAAAGARVYALNQELFETNTLGRLRMQAWIVDHMQMIRDGKMAIVSIPLAVEQELGVTQDDMDNISSFPRTVAGVCMAATLRETKEGDTKISVRAVPGYDATLVATRFGGGGHKGAAGAAVKMSIEETAKAVEAVMLEL